MTEKDPQGNPEPKKKTEAQKKQEKDEMVNLWMTNLDSNPDAHPDSEAPKKE